MINEDRVDDGYINFWTFSAHVDDVSNFTTDIDRFKRWKQRIFDATEGFENEEWYVAPPTDPHDLNEFLQTKRELHRLLEDQFAKEDAAHKRGERYFDGETYSEFPS